MHILHVLRTMNPAWGGPVEGVKNLAAEAAHLGHPVEIVCLDLPQSPWLKNSCMRVNAIGPGTCGKFGYSRRLGPWLDENITRFDIVVANGVWMYFSAAVRRAAMKADIPYFVFTHGALDPWFRRRYPLKHAKKQIYWSLVEHKVLRDAAAVLFTTSEEKALSHGAFWPYACRPHVVGYGIRDPFLCAERAEDFTDARRRLNRRLPALGDRPFLLFLARVHEKKGIDLLLPAIARNSRNYEGHAFVVAGPGDESYVSELKGQAAQLGLEKQIIWAGPLYDEMKWAAIREAEAFILPSHQENFGISVAEALACRVPVLITNKVNIWREIVAEGGGLAENDDIRGICNLLEQWSALRPDRKTAMRDRARRCFLEHFDISNTSHNLFNLFAQRLNYSATATVSECVS